MFDEKFVRMWRLYLAGSVAGSRPARCSCSRWYSRPRDNNNIPLTRAHLYQLSELARVRPAMSDHGGRRSGGLLGGAWALRRGWRGCARLDKESFPRLKLCAGWITPEVVRTWSWISHTYPYRFLTFGACTCICGRAPADALRAALDPPL
jgi:hypothetical protein